MLVRVIPAMSMASPRLQAERHRQRRAPPLAERLARVPPLIFGAEEFARQGVLRRVGGDGARGGGPTPPGDADRGGGVVQEIADPVGPLAPPAIR